MRAQSEEVNSLTLALNLPIFQVEYFNTKPEGQKAVLGVEEEGTCGAGLASR